MDPNRQVGRCSWTTRNSPVFALHGHEIRFNWRTKDHVVWNTKYRLTGQGGWSSYLLRERCIDSQADTRYQLWSWKNQVRDPIREHSIVRPLSLPTQALSFVLAIHPVMSSSILSKIMMLPVQLVVELKRWLKGADAYILVQVYPEGSVLVPAFHVKKDESQNDTEYFDFFLPSLAHPYSMWVWWRSVATRARAY